MDKLYTVERTSGFRVISRSNSLSVMYLIWVSFPFRLKL